MHVEMLYLVNGDRLSVRLHVKEVAKRGEGCVHERVLEKLVGVDVLVLCAVSKVLVSGNQGSVHGIR